MKDSNLSSLVGLHFISLLFFLLWSSASWCFSIILHPVMFSLSTHSLSLLIRSVLFCSVNSSNWNELLWLSLCFTNVSFSVVYLFFSHREASWWGGSETEPHLCGKSSVVCLRCFLLLAFVIVQKPLCVYFTKEHFRAARSKASIKDTQRYSLMAFDLLSSSPVMWVTWLNSHWTFTVNAMRQWDNAGTFPRWEGLKTPCFWVMCQLRQLFSVWIRNPQYLKVRINYWQIMGN